MESDRSLSSRSRAARRARWAALAAIPCLLSLSAAPAAAALQGSGEDSAIVSPERLFFEMKCFYDIPEWQGKGEERFLERLAAHRKAYETDAKMKDKLPLLDELYGDCLWKRKDKYEAEGNKEKVKEICRTVAGLSSDYGRLKDYKEQAREYLFTQDFEAAKAALKANNVPVARELWKGLLGHPKAEKSAVEAFVAMDRNESGIDTVNASDLEAVSAVLDKLVVSIEKSIGPALYAKYKATDLDISDMEKRRSDIKNTTQYLEVGTFDVSKSLEGVAGGKSPLDLEKATFVFEPVTKDVGRRFPEQGAPTKLAKAKFLYYRGVYDVTVYLPSQEGRPVAVFLGFTLGDAPAKLEIPNGVPDGMVFAGPWKGGGGFFVDVTEVTVAQVKAVQGANEDLAEVVTETKGQPEDPAWFLSEASALAFESASGKKIPTAEQWVEAAFGPYSASQRPYPWGREAPTEEHAFVGANAESPQATGGRTKGASPFHARDMVGNLAEWVRNGDQLYLLGGNFLTPPGALTNTSGKNPMRDPQPGKAAFDAKSETMDTEAAKEFKKYMVDGTESYVTGLRMIVPVR